MKKEKIELIAVIVLVVIFLSFLANTLKRTFTRQKPAPVQANKIKKTEYQIPKVERPLQQPEIQPLGWGRDPFVLFESMGIDRQAAIVLSGIIWDKRQPKAMINNEVYGIGDKIGNIEILGIKKNSVIIEKNGKKLEIHLE